MERHMKNLAHTSVEESKGSLRFIKEAEQIEFLKNVIKYKLHYGNKEAVIRILKAKIRELEGKKEL
jgi:hypothetical protein